MSPKRIKVGDKAPNFEIESYNEGKINLENLISENQDKKIVMIFSRYFGCPICQLDLQELIENKQKIEENNGILLYVTQSGEDLGKKGIEHFGIDFPVLPSNPNGLYADYGLGKMTLTATAGVPKKLVQAKKAGFTHGEYEGLETQCPGQFVIDNTGTIIHARRGWLYLPGIIGSLL